MTLSYTDDNVPSFKPVSAVNNELVWKKNSMSCQRLNGRTFVLCGEALLTEREQLHSTGADCLLLFPSLWLQPSGQKGEKENSDPAMRVTDVLS